MDTDTCSGTIGNVIFTNSTFEGRIATHDLIRVVPDDSKMLKGVVYAYLSSKYGYCQLTQSKFGGVVKHIMQIMYMIYLYHYSLRHAKKK